jgi:murein DD-endopeptidase
MGSGSLLHRGSRGYSGAMLAQVRQFVTAAVLAWYCLGLAGCATAPVASDSVGHRAAATALQQVGTPYRYGGSTPAGFDCSGLVHYAYTSAGVSIPRTTTGQWSKLPPVAERDMRPGDLVFFNIEGKMSHVGMYIGDGRFVHAPSTGKRVAVEDLGSRYYSRAFIRAGRPR